ncbi:hypothetical protein FJY93_01200 [Candidatus Kaiserbacteria bacterium]|nr:hypothetical protein [Candidatus Kaiserbacteria bacterium]
MWKNLFKGKIADVIIAILIVAAALGLIAEVSRTHFTFLHAPVVEASQMMQPILVYLAMALVIWFCIRGMLSALWEPFKAKEEPAKGGGGGGSKKDKKPDQKKSDNKKKGEAKH